ncbi:MAG: HAD family phosphatase [Candidatus Thiodiazotropha taylori]|uniref:HAD family phosphatase n=1 Tax=Candidatus Thiodiazotropha taylori TaxID=2792791 RepID=A0A9E4N3Y2_9GAMM|nr:HAD family phosphatase [Candidatus Thiodiazotropha taylori]MCW4256345.1 HAD family phosphatase [Candidatus Thiodiazotropha taylori]
MGLTPHAWRCIFFDLDGTLVDSEGVSLDTLVTFANETNIELSKSELDWFRSATWDLCLDSLIAKHSISLTYESLRSLIFNRLIKLYQESPPPLMSGALSAFLAAKKVATVGIVTSSPSILVKPLLLAHPVFTSTQILITAEDVKSQKPSSEPYLVAASRFGISPQDCIVFEDSPGGVQSATKAGMCACVVGEYAKSTLGFTSISSLAEVSVPWLHSLRHKWLNTL